MKHLLPLALVLLLAGCGDADFCIPRPEVVEKGAEIRLPSLVCPAPVPSHEYP